MCRRDELRIAHFRTIDFGKECRSMSCGSRFWTPAIVCVLLASGCRTPADSATASKSSLTSIFKARTVSNSIPETEPEIIPEIKDPTELNLAFARWMEDVGNLGEARKKYSEVADAKPKNLEAVLGLARIDQLSGMSHEAEQGFLRAQKLAPDAPEALNALGQFYASEKRWPDAVTQLNKAMLAAPAEKSYRYNLAVAMAYNGDIEGALPHFVRTVGDAEAHYNVGLILKDQARYAEAEEHLLLAVTKKPDLHQAQVWLDEVRHEQETTLSQAPAGSGVHTAALQTGGHSAASVAPTTGRNPAAPPSGLSPQQLQQRANQRPAQW
jgi:tetratricopeptide (TPR) repeat protein